LPAYGADTFDALPPDHTIQEARFGVDALAVSEPGLAVPAIPGGLGVSAPGLAQSAPECSVGIMAYNEEANIADAIDSILGQRLTSSRIAELIVVASGCEDRTAEIVAGVARGDARVRLIEQRRREGKASAINLFIQAVRSEVLLMVSADVLVKDGTFDALMRHFNDPAVGMVGGHPTPVNDEATFLGHAVHLQWRLHDRIARQSPKLGEIVAFRNVVPSIPLDTAVDEISIQALLSQLGYRLVYEPRAVVYNRGPTTLRDFIRQRRRIYAGHLRVREQQGYSASTMSARRVGGALWGSGSFATPRAAVWSVGTVGLEATARALGHYDVVRRRPQHVWEISGTTKSHIADGANADGQQTVAVFHIVDFHRRQLEVGVHSSRQLTRRVADQIKRGLGSKAIVSIQQGGTIVAVLLGDRTEAERAARALVHQLEAAPLPLNGHGKSIRVAVACALIAFQQAGPPVTSAVPPGVELEAGALRAGPAASVAG
jgi:glycosyltransferase involved in cell wall biosynthesis